MLIRYILTGSAYLQNAEQSIVGIILRSVELPMWWAPKKHFEMANSYMHMRKFKSMFRMEWMSGCARSLCDLQLYMKVTESHPLPCLGCWTLQVCRSRLHLQCFLCTTYSTSALSVECQRILGVQQVARNDWKFQIGISGSLHYQSLPISLWEIIRGVK